MVEERRIETEEGVKKKHHKRALFTVVDLAGSERLAKSKSSEIRLEEAKAINKSISALGNCISALTSREKHIPFRDSKLTRVLTNSLSGNSKTTLIACISPSLIQYEESLLTLMFAFRATGVTTCAMVNEEILMQHRPRTPEIRTELARKNALLESENVNLQKELAELRKSQGIAIPRLDLERGKSCFEFAKRTNKSVSGDATDRYGKTDRTDGGGVRKYTLSEKELQQQPNQVIKRMVEVIRKLQAKIAEKVLLKL